MFTIESLNRAKSAIALNQDDRRYTPQKNQLSFELFNYPQSGVAVERMVCERMQSAGIDASRVGDADSHDISLYVGGRIVRAEVKSSVQSANGRYKFHGVKPEKFDILLFAFIHPTEGLVIRSCGSADVRNWIESSGAKIQRDGYNINFPKSMQHNTIPTIEWDTDRGFAMA